MVKNTTMSTNHEIPPDDSDGKITRAVKYHQDIDDTRREPQLEENNFAATAEAEQLVHGVDEFIEASKDGLSQDEVKYFLQKLDTAIAISNDPEAREIRRNLIERYGDSK